MKRREKTPEHRHLLFRCRFLFPTINFKFIHFLVKRKKKPRRKLFIFFITSLSNNHLFRTPLPFSLSLSLTLPYTHTHISRKHEEVGPTSFIEAPSLNYLHNKDEIRLKTDGFNLRGKTGRKNLRFLSQLKKSNFLLKSKKGSSGYELNVIGSFWFPTQYFMPLNDSMK